jgi:hypothetical protein
VALASRSGPPRLARTRAAVGSARREAGRTRRRRGLGRSAGADRTGPGPADPVPGRCRVGTAA